MSARPINRIKSCSCSREQHEQHIPPVITAPHRSLGEHSLTAQGPGVNSAWGAARIDPELLQIGSVSLKGLSFTYSTGGWILSVLRSSINTDKFFIKGGILIIERLTGCVCFQVEMLNSFKLGAGAAQTLHNHTGLIFSLIASWPVPISTPHGYRAWPVSQQRWHSDYGQIITFLFRKKCFFPMLNPN